MVNELYRRINMAFPNRTACTVLDEMRKSYETRNFCYLLGLIEELQTMVSRMEASLYDKSDVKDYAKQRSELWKELESLREERNKLNDELGKPKKKEWEE
jgi:hypothetical protein